MEKQKNRVGSVKIGSERCGGGRFMKHATQHLLRCKLLVSISEHNNSILLLTMSGAEVTGGARFPEKVGCVTVMLNKQGVGLRREMFLPAAGSR